ncbi:MAG: L-2-hydroxyglutarate oxidase [Acidobacteria bacterium]|nr:L-2-hydroxyglutarate oxidase [Acidobacteriota bacterium]
MTSPTCVIGGGLVGLATAWALRRRHPELPLLLLEKEAEVGTHQTGRNSGVVHSGIYYSPGSLRARLCREGAERMAAFCEAEGLPFRRCGKVIVATRPEELPRLEALAARAQANGIEAHRLGPEGLAEHEPHATGLAALRLPATGITDYGAVARRLKAKLLDAGVAIHLGREATGLQPRGEGVLVRWRGGEIFADRVITCAGLHADRVHGLQSPPPARIIPFRGEYHLLSPEGAALVKGLIYPVPDPALPFLGVHLTRGIHGEVDAGPNAVLALAREGYTWSTLSARDLAEVLTYPGFWRLVRKQVRTGAYEVARSLSKQLLLRDLRRLVPALQADHLLPGPAGVRAQAVLPNGLLADDFLVARVGRCLHVLNAPSPAATASLAIGEFLADRMAEG